MLFRADTPRGDEPVAGPSAGLGGIASRDRTRFTPGEAAEKILRPAESFDAVRVDLNARFDIARSGTYRVRVSLTKESGVAEGDSKSDVVPDHRETGQPDEAGPDYGSPFHVSRPRILTCTSGVSSCRDSTAKFG